MTPSSRIERLGLLVRTVRHLRPSQVGHRLRLRGQKALFHTAPELTSRGFSGTRRADPGWPGDYLPLDGVQATGYPSAAENAQGIFDFVGERRSLGDPADWEPQEASQLWRYNLHYMEWAWALAAEPDVERARAQFGELWRAWRQGTVFGRWDAWSPYVVSLRAWVLCGVFHRLVAGGPDEQAFLDDLVRHTRFIRANLEHDVGGNHLIKNLKGLLGTALFLSNPRAERVALTKLQRELDVQVLADGGHYERSPSYHCQVLGDLIDIQGLLHAADRPRLDGLDDAVERMRGWLGAMLLPDGDVPLFNDCTLVGKERLGLLSPHEADPGPLTVLADSGYVVMRPSPRVHVIADAGPPCPPELPAHAHADCLSFVMSVDGERFLVDTGTSTYQSGWVRDHERSTRAHNTVEVGGVNQTEVWGSFRAAHRANPRLETATHQTGVIEVTASHDGYERLPGRPRHRRIWRATPEQLEVIDEVTGQHHHLVVSRLHLASGTTATGIDGHIEAAGCRLTFDGGSAELTPPEAAAPTKAWAASHFGERMPVAVITHRAPVGPAPRLQATIRWSPEEAEDNGTTTKGAP